MTSTRALEEKNQKALRELLQIPSNKRCFDCVQKGPVYANVTIGTFVCTQCSGILRELSHRVKSISMSTFTAQEVEKLKKIGNEEARKEWRANWNETEYPLPDPSQTSYLKKLIYLTYQDKEFKKKGKSDDQPKKSSRQRRKSRSSKEKSPKSKGPRIPKTEPLSSLLGDNIPSLREEDSFGSDPFGDHSRSKPQPGNDPFGTTSQGSFGSDPFKKKEDDLFDFLSTPSSSSQQEGVSSSVIGDLGSLYSQQPGGTSSFSASTPALGSNPFSENTSLYGNGSTVTADPRIDEKIRELEVTQGQLREAISLREGQINLGQQNYNQLTPDVKNKLMVMMETQKQHQQKLIEITNEINNLKQQKASSSSSANLLGQGGYTQQQHGMTSSSFMGGSASQGSLPLQQGSVPSQGSYTSSSLQPTLSPQQGQSYTSPQQTQLGTQGNSMSSYGGMSTTGNTSSYGGMSTTGNTSSYGGMSTAGNTSSYGGNQSTYGTMGNTSSFGGNTSSTSPFGGNTSSTSPFGGNTNSTSSFGHTSNTSSFGNTSNTSPFGGQFNTQQQKTEFNPFS